MALTKEQKTGLGFLGALAAFFGIRKLTKAAVCTPGEPKCEGYDLYQCSPEHKWVLVEANSPTCGWTPGAAEFTVTDLLIEPAEVYVGEPVSISALVTNVGGEVGTKTVQLEVS